MVGLSTKTILWRAFSQLVVFFYLLDENTSLLVKRTYLNLWIELFSIKLISK
jgi:hypothetical protein